MVNKDEYIYITGSATS